MCRAALQHTLAHLKCSHTCSHSHSAGLRQPGMAHECPSLDKTPVPVTVCLAGWDRWRVVVRVNVIVIVLQDNTQRGEATKVAGHYQDHREDGTLQAMLDQAAWSQKQSLEKRTKLDGQFGTITGE